MDVVQVLTDWLQSGLSAIVPFVILLGLLIFVHEMGHFLVAKFYKVRVEVFSLGFGKKIFQFKRGDTIYCLSLIPLGGYVKMFGDDPTVTVNEEDRATAFLHKPVGQRIAIVLAGPLMNFFFAILIFALIAFSGETRLAPQIGDVDKNSQAYSAGFRSGDKISSIDGKKITTWQQAIGVIQKNHEKSLLFEVKRKKDPLSSSEPDRESDFRLLEVQATPVLGDNPNILSPESQVGQIDGLTIRSRSSVVAVRSKESAAFLAGIRTGDLIKKVGDIKVQHWRELVAVFEKASFPLMVQIERQDEGAKNSKDPKPLTFTLQTNPLGSSLEEHARSVFTSLGFDNPELYLQKIMEDSPAKDAGIKKGDLVASINGKKINQWTDVVKFVSSFKEDQKPIKIGVKRDEEPLSFVIIPEKTRQVNRQGLEESRYTIGIMPIIFSALPSTLKVRETNPVKALWRGTTRTWSLTVMTVVSLVKLFQAEISPKNIGGVISIGQVAQKTFKIGWVQFLQMMAIISINLFIINLLPVPILDGGHLLFFTIEAIRGAPLSLKKMEMAQQLGLIVLVSLMAFALFNDFSRLFNFNW